MKSILDNDTFTCCYLLEEDNTKLYVGSLKGSLYIVELLTVDEIKKLTFDDKFVRVMKSYRELAVIKGTIRSIQRFNEDNLIIISDYGAIVFYNLKNNQIYKLRDNDFSYTASKNKLWRLLVIDENNFLTSGNFNQLYLWHKSKTSYSLQSFEKGKQAIFCLDWFNEDTQKILTNDYQGETKIWSFINGELKLQKIFILADNLQKTIIFEGMLISVDYFGNTHVYRIDKEENMQKMDEFTISGHRGNWVHLSKENDFILIGTEYELIFIDKSYETINIINNIQIKQIFSIDDLDLFLIGKSVVRVDQNKRIFPEVLQKYKYVKIGLVGNSGAGKTCFCKYLETRTFVDTESSLGKHVWTIPFDQGENKVVQYYDLAGQSNELFTYFPLIKDVDIILLFFKSSDQDTFDKAIQYYNELKISNKNTQFFFIQAFDDYSDDRKIREGFIKDELESIGFDPELHLVKTSSKSGSGFQDYTDKVLHNYDWSNAPNRMKLKIHDTVEKEIHLLYTQGIENITLQNLKKKVDIPIKMLKGTILNLVNEGMIDFIEQSNLVLINDKKYAVFQSKIANRISEKGFLDTKTILDFYSEKNPLYEKYIRNIIQYYRNNQIARFYKEGDDEEIIIFPNKLPNSIAIPSDIKEIKEVEKIIFEYNNEINPDTFLLELSDIPLVIKGLSKHEFLFLVKNTNSPILIELNIKKTYEETSNFICTFRINITDDRDKTIRKTLIDKIMNCIGNNLIKQISELNELQKKISESNPIETIKKILSYPKENQFMDFKTEYHIENRIQKAEAIKDVCALTNSSISNNNTAYLVIGLEEQDGKIISVKDVSNNYRLGSQIPNLIGNSIAEPPFVEIHEFKINQLTEWQKKKEISNEIPFKASQSNPSNQGKILLIKLTRSPNSVCESDRRINNIKEGDSWFRISSHTYLIRQYYRDNLRAN